MLCRTIFIFGIINISKDLCNIKAFYFLSAIYASARGRG